MTKRFARLGLLFLVVSFFRADRCRGPALADVSIDGAGSTWVQIALQQWAADVARQGHVGQLPGCRLDLRTRLLLPGPDRLRGVGDPVHAAYRDATGSVITNEVSLAVAPAVRLHARRRRRHVVHVPPVDQRSAGHDPAAHARDQSPRSLRASSRTGTIRLSHGTTRSSSSRISRCVRSCDPTVRAPPRSSRRTWRPRSRRSTTRTARKSGSPSARARLCPCGPTSTRCRSSSPTAWPTTSPRPTTTARSPTWSTGTRSSAGYPVASVLNNAGYFTQPTPGNVAVALTKATLNADLTQNLGGVYNNPDPRTYPVSSYSYLIVPTKVVAPFTAAKGATLSKFILYLACAGQQEAAQLGLLAAAAEPRARRVQRRDEDSRSREPAADQPVRQPDDHERRSRQDRPASASDRPARSALPPTLPTATTVPSSNGVQTGVQSVPTVTSPPVGGSGAPVGGEESRQGERRGQGGGRG